MRKVWLMLLLAMAGNAWAAGGAIEKLFREMPFVLCPALNAQQRMELLEYAKAGTSDSIRNTFGTWSHMTEVDTERGFIRCSPAHGSEMEMLLVGDSVCRIGVIETVCAPVCSSIVALYDSAWNKLPLEMPEFQAADFIDAEACRADSVPVEDVLGLLPPYFVRARFANDSSDLIFTNETIRQLSPQKQKRYAKYLREKRVSLF